MLDRLMRRTVFSQSDGIVSHHMDDADAHQGRQPDRGAAVIGEGEKGASVWDKAAMQRDAIHCRCHGVLADAIVNIAAVKGTGTHRLVCPGARQVGMGEIGRAAQQIRQGFRDRVDHQLRRLPCRNVGLIGREAIADISHRLGISAGQISVQCIVER